MNDYTALLSVKNLTVDYFVGGHVSRAVDDVSFSIRDGEVFALVGESGSGKSTIALAIMRLIPPGQGRVVAGEVVFAGQNLTGLGEKQMRRICGSQIAMAFQEPAGSFNPILTMGRQIAEPMMLHKGMNKREAMRHAVELLEAVGIRQPDIVAKWYPHQLSGGMRQRAMIAMAIGCGPRLLIADEPTSALDAATQMEILSLLEKLRREMSILLITHDLRIAARYCDGIAVMRASRIVETGESSAVLTRPRHPYTLGLLECAARMRGADVERRTQNTELRI